jgi:hypothetical protein
MTHREHPFAARDARGAFGSPATGPPLALFDDPIELRFHGGHVLAHPLDVLMTDVAAHDARAGYFFFAVDRLALGF